MNKETKENTIAWVKNEIKELRNKSLKDISFPAKVASNKIYKNLPIFKRALDNTPTLSKKTGELFYWIYIKPDRDPYVETHIYIDNEIDEIRKSDIAKKDIILEYAKKDIDKKRIKVKHQKDKPCNVSAFDENNSNHIDKDIDVDWELMKKRNIINKAEVIFEAMEWSMEELGIIGKKKVTKQSEKVKEENKDEVAEYINNLKKEENPIDKLKEKLPVISSKEIKEDVINAINEVRKGDNTPQNKAKVAEIKDISTVDIETPELPIKEAEKVNMCDFEQCTQNKDGICIAKEGKDCPKNNDQSVYEKEELLKKKEKYLKIVMNRIKAVNNDN